MVLSTQAIRDLLPYRGVDSQFIFINQDSHGFGIRFLLPQSSDIRTVHHLLLELEHEISPHAFHSTLVIYHHHYQFPFANNPHYYLFVSTNHPFKHHQTLKRYRDMIMACFNHHKISHWFITYPDFLIVLRTLISPDLTCTTWPSMIDIQQTSFHQSIPNPGTTFHLFEHDIGIISPTAHGLLANTRLIGYDIKIIPDPLLINHLLTLQCKWLMVISTKTMQHQLLLLTTPQETLQKRDDAMRIYANLDLSPQAWNTPLHSFFRCLPFGAC
ncbi:MAG: hypothetical protein CK424_04645 [Legionella sp.]|nr:MAG: hypothetical protein CK424_04645 [Legionella sp.]